MTALVEDTLAQATALAGKFLTFQLDEEIYGLEILKVQEIIGLMSITRVPRTPGYVRGVINLRGKVIPVIELRTKFQMSPVPDTEKTCIIVAQIEHADSTLTMGLLVDEVAEVLDIAAEQIESPPCFGGISAMEFILGIGKIDQKVIMLLDVDRALSANEFSVLVGVNDQEKAPDMGSENDNSISPDSKKQPLEPGT